MGSKKVKLKDRGAWGNFLTTEYIELNLNHFLLQPHWSVFDSFVFDVLKTDTKYLRKGEHASINFHLLFCGNLFLYIAILNTFLQYCDGVANTYRTISGI
jgi:hypothetical protein